MSEVRFEGVVKRFDGVAAVDRVDLEIPEGEFFTLLGESGCGKTTALRLIAGFEEPNEGVVRIGGRVVNGVPPDRRNTAMVFQNYALFPHLDVFGNIAFGLKARHVPRPEIEMRVAEALRLVELQGLESRRVHDLSGGQQQRVALARAAVVRPGILLLDEPLSNLDARLRKSTRAGLSRVQRTLGTTAIYVTHDQEEALALSDRIAVMRSGRIEQVGTPREIYETPRTAYVARFVGETNLLMGRLREDSGAGWFIELHGGASAPAISQALESLARHATPVSGLEVRLALKPESLRLAEDGDAIRLPLEVSTIEYGGAAVSVSGETPAGPVLMRVPTRRPNAPRAGDRVEIAFDPSNALLFPKSHAG